MKVLKNKRIVMFEVSDEEEILCTPFVKFKQIITKKINQNVRSRKCVLKG